MNFFERRKYKKGVHHLLHESKHAYHMRRDIADAKDLDRLEQDEQSLRIAWKERRWDDLDASAQRLADSTAAVLPRPSNPQLREIVEIMVVALVIAWGLRTYFVQPFKIPTGSMQPTLYGITVKKQHWPETRDKFPLSMVNLVLFGERHVTVKAKTTGQVRYINPAGTSQGEFVDVADVIHRVKFKDMQYHVKLGDTVTKGNIIASGRKRAGDHIFVNKVKYNFAPPRRGDVFVFSTRNIDHPRIRPDNFYIKRLSGMPGDRVSIHPPCLLIDGEKLMEPYPFERVVRDREGGYSGYFLAHRGPYNPALLTHPSEEIRVGEMEYLPLGDNSQHSLDGKYFGTVQAKDVVGPAFMVYWPLSKRWGPVQ